MYATAYIYVYNIYIPNGIKFASEMENIFAQGWWGWEGELESNHIIKL